MQKAITFLEQQITDTHNRLSMLQHVRNEFLSEENRLADQAEEDFLEDPIEEAVKPGKKSTGGRLARKKKVAKKAKKKKVGAVTAATLDFMRKKPNKAWSVAAVAKGTKSQNPATSMRLRKCIKDGTVERVSAGMYKLTTAGR